MEDKMAIKMIDLSHPFYGDMPLWPYFSKPEIAPMHSMAKGGVLTQTIKTTMHTGTHADAPRHVMERMFNGKRALYSHELPVDAYTGDAVCLDVRTKRWQLITPADLDDAVARAGLKPADLKGLVVCLRTGMHLKYDDSKEYYHYSLGCGIDAGEWFVAHKVKCVAMDQQALDHPLHTSIGNNGTRMKLEGYTGKSVCDEFIEQFGIEAYAEFDKDVYIKVHGRPAYDKKFGKLEAIGCYGTWEPCHKTLLGNGVVGVENLGGDLEKVVNKRFRFYALPIRWHMGDGSMVRAVAEIEEDQINPAPERLYPFGAM
jgi:kynurenine formamidase